MITGLFRLLLVLVAFVLVRRMVRGALGLGRKKPPETTSGSSRPPGPESADPEKPKQGEGPQQPIEDAEYEELE